jgi:hypothetical protein
MCPCQRVVGVICAAHCKKIGCRDGFHTDLCVGPGPRMLLESLHRPGVNATPEFVAVFDAAEAAIAEVLR